MKDMFKKIYMLGILLIALISAVFIIQYSYMNNIIIENKEFNIEKSREVLGQRINNELKLYSQVIESTSNLIMGNNWSEEIIKDNIKKIFKENPIFNFMYYGDGENNIMVDVIGWEVPEGYDVRTRPWYIKALEKEGLTYSETYVDALTGNLTITISKPIYNADNEIMGVIGGDILIDEIVEIVENSSPGLNDIGYSFLIDGEGNILARPDHMDDNYLNNISDTLLDEMKENKYGEIKMRLDNVDGYLSYQPIDNTDWIIGSFATLKEYNVNNQYVIGMLVFTLLAGLFIVSMFFYMQNRYFIKPLKSLVKDIEGINIEKDIMGRIALDEKDPFLAPRRSINKILEKAESFFRKQEEFGNELLTSYEELESQNMDLYNLSYFDHLTGIYNRRFFEKEIRKLDFKENLPIGIIMADVNGLKLINDSFGHEVGDQLLIKTGKILKDNCKDEESVFRIGGDEFVILVRQTSPKKMVNLVSRIRESSKVVNLCNIKLSISFGLAIKYKKSQDLSDILKEAEDNMYANKLVEEPSMRSKTIDTIVQTLYEKNAREEAHSTRVSAICQQMAIHLEMTDDQIKQLETVGLLHDIGKIAISNEILEKPDSLNNLEWEQIKKHPEIGYRILRTTSEMAQIAEYVLSHHERYDGNGYPRGLKGDEIPLVSRIIIIADSYDAMISDRPYRKGLPQEIVIEEIVKGSGTQFDPTLAKLFIEKVLGEKCEENNPNSML